MTETIRADGDKSIRKHWAPGLLGWLSYFTDHVCLRHTRPVDWNGMLALELTGHGTPFFTAGGAHVLYGGEVDALRLVATDADDASIAQALRISHASAAKLRASLHRRFGTSNAAELTAIAIEHGIR